MQIASGFQPGAAEHSLLARAAAAPLQLAKVFSQHHYLFRLHLSWQGCGYAGFVHATDELASNPLFNDNHLCEHLPS